MKGKLLELILAVILFRLKRLELPNAWLSLLDQQLCFGKTNIDASFLSMILNTRTIFKPIQDSMARLERLSLEVFYSNPSAMLERKKVDGIQLIAKEKFACMVLQQLVFTGLIDRE